MTTTILTTEQREFIENVIGAALDNEGDKGAQEGIGFDALRDVQVDLETSQDLSTYSLIQLGVIDYAAEIHVADEDEDEMAMATEVRRLVRSAASGTAPDQEVANHVTSYWLDHYVNGHYCSLCGNSGQIDTRGTRTAAGVEVGRVNFCICPNGQALRAAYESR
jgi:hypothetical protein